MVFRRKIHTGALQAGRGLHHIRPSDGVQRALPVRPSGRRPRFRAATLADGFAALLRHDGTHEEGGDELKVGREAGKEHA